MKFNHLIILLVTIAAVSALQEASVNQGNTLTLRTSIPSNAYEGQLWQTNIAYDISQIQFHYTFVESEKPSNTIENKLPFTDVPIGDYKMLVILKANGEVVSRSYILVHVLPKSSTTTTTTPKKDQGIVVLEIVKPTYTITIPAIPDMTPGTTFVMPVTISGKGTFQLEIPKLSFASYEAPLTITVDGEKTVPVLIHIDQDAAPGTYIIPVTVGNEQTSSRIRIIKYVESNSWWMLVPVGIILIILGTVLLLSRKQKQQKKPKEDGEVITYY